MPRARQTLRVHWSLPGSAAQSLLSSGHFWEKDNSHSRHPLFRCTSSGRPLLNAPELQLHPRAGNFPELEGAGDAVDDPSSDEELSTTDGFQWLPQRVLTGSGGTNRIHKAGRPRRWSAHWNCKSVEVSATNCSVGGASFTICCSKERIIGFSLRLFWTSLSLLLHLLVAIQVMQFVSLTCATRSTKA